MEFSIGQVIYSKSGRDKRRPFIILSIQGEYLYLADGKLRLVQKPKKKKKMHAQPTNYIDDEIAVIISNSKLLKDSDVRTALSRYAVK